MQTHIYHLLFATVLTMALLIPAGPCPAQTKELQPPDVFRLVTLANAKIEHLRWFMGRPKNVQAMPDVTNVSPHEVYFQATSLYTKADRLAFGFTFESLPMPQPPPGEIQPAHVYMVIEAALERLTVVADHLDTHVESSLPQRDPAKTPTDVFKATVQASRQLNLMLSEPISSSDAFWQTTIALSYADAILKGMPDPPAPPLPTPVEPGKQPSDVFKHLKRTFGLVKKIGEGFGLQMLDLQRWTSDDESIRPSDGHDLASLLTSELVYIHKHVKKAPSPVKVIRPINKLPSDTCHRANVLERQLREILKRQ